MDVGGRATQDAYMDVSGTIPRKESVESSREQRPRTTQETKSSSCRGAEALPTGKAKIVPDNLFAFPPSLAVMGKEREH